MDNFEYYFIESKNDQTYPLIKEVDYEPDDINPTFVYLEFNDPIPRNPVMADFLAGPEIYITYKIANEIKKLNIEGVKLIPTQLTDNKGNVSEDYFCMLVDNDIEAMDKEESVFEYEFRIYSIDKFYLNKKALSEIPLKERLIFVLEESPEKVLFHKSVVDAIMAVNPTGMEFINIEGYGGF